MYERFTDTARRVMQTANLITKEWKHEYIGSEHILLSIIRLKQGIGFNALSNMIDVSKIEVKIRTVLNKGVSLIEVGKLPLTPRSKAALDCANSESLLMGHKYTGTEHLILGLIRVEDAVAAQVLIGFGITYSDLKKEILNVLNNNELNEKERILILRIYESAIRGLEEEVQLLTDNFQSVFGKEQNENFDRLYQDIYDRKKLLIKLIDQIKGVK